MKLVAVTTMAGVALAKPQGLPQMPSARFGASDIAEMIKQMGATGAAAQALYAQFASLDGYRSQQQSNAVGAIAGFNAIGAGYGCWCYFGDDHIERRAKGPPLDTLDGFCHTLSRGYECATIDIDGCVPWDIDYNTADDLTAVPDTKEDVAAMCQTENGGVDNTCQYFACAVEGWWLKQVKIAGDLPALIDDTNKHSDADWDAKRTAMCKGPAVGNDRQIECCGIYPERFPYNTLAPNKVCCTDGSGIQTYVANTAYEQCCPDGTILGFGETC